MSTIEPRTQSLRGSEAGRAPLARCARETGHEEEGAEHIPGRHVLGLDVVGGPGTSYLFGSCLAGRLPRVFGVTGWPFSPCRGQQRTLSSAATSIFFSRATRRERASSSACGVTGVRLAGAGDFERADGDLPRAAEGGGTRGVGRPRETNTGRQDPRHHGAGIHALSLSPGTPAR